MPLNPVPATSKNLRPAFFAIAFLIAVPILLFAPLFLSGKIIYGFDLLTLGIPFRAEIQQSLACGHLPLWMPDIYGGMPGIAACNLLFLYPIDLISALSGWTAGTQCGLDAIVHVALSGIGMFLFLRSLDRSLAGSLLGAFFFAVSGSQVSVLFGGYYNLLEGIALVPWAFWAAYKGLKEGSWFAWGLCGLVFALQILAESAQIFAYTLPAVAAFVLVPEWSRSVGASKSAPADRRLSVFRGLVLALALAFLIAAPQLLPTLQYLPLCMRQGYTHAVFNGGSIGLPEALSWLVPGFFGWRIPTYHGQLVGSTCVSEYFGLLPWALAAGALSALWRREPLVRWFAALALTAFFFAQNGWTPFYHLFVHLPVISGFRFWSRILFLVTFSICSLAAYGWDALRTTRDQKTVLHGAAFFSGVAFLAAAIAWLVAKGCAPPDLTGLGYFPSALSNPQAQAAILAAIAGDSARTTLALVPILFVLLWLVAKRLGPGTALVLALAFHVQDQKSVYERFVKFMDPQVAVDRRNFPLPAPGPEPWRVFDDDPTYSNWTALHGYENLGGAESVSMKSSQQIMVAMAQRKKDWLDLMNVRYVIGSAGSGNTVAVGVNPGAFHRAWLVTKIRELSDDGEAYRILADPKFDPGTEVALAGDARLGQPPAAAGPPKGGIQWLGRDPQTSDLDVSTDRDAVLVLSNAWYPSWRCEVDGRGTEVLKADGGLQAVLLGPGRHRVDFRFDNGLFYDALAACLAGLAALAGLAFVEKRRKP
jgi:hypothetical protein